MLFLLLVLDVTHWLWGGFSVDNATLNRFFSLHYLLPFIIAGASILHLAALHQYGSNNPLGCLSNGRQSVVLPVFLFLKISWVGWCLRSSFRGLSFLRPIPSGIRITRIPANPMVSPPRTLFRSGIFYRSTQFCVRSIPNKLAGVLAIGLSFRFFAFATFLKTPLPYGVQRFVPYTRNFFGFLWRMPSSWAGLVASRLKTLMSSCWPACFGVFLFLFPHRDSFSR